METQPIPPQDSVVSYLTMRKTIGWLGVLLPFLLLSGNFFLNTAGVFNNDFFVQDPGKYASAGSWKSSVSHYYYTTVGEVFTGTLCAVAMFMICYNGHPKRKGDKGLSDNTMTNLAGCFALGVALFPTSGGPIGDNLRSFVSSTMIGWIHYSFAASFFVVLAFMAIINFRRSADQEKFGQGPDDPFYLRCGILLLVWLALVPICGMIPWLAQRNSTFILEALALVTFGICWLKKGQTDLLFIPRKIGLAK